MVKCEVLTGFSATTCHGRAGEIIEIPYEEAQKFESVKLLRILPDSEQDPPPMAYETAQKAIKAETATIKRGKK